MLSFYWIVSVTLLVVACVACLAEPVPQKMEVWVLAGQSNMQGCGYVQDGLPADPHVLMFSSAGAWTTASDPLHRPWESPFPIYRENEDKFYQSMTQGMNEEQRQAWIRGQHSIGVGPGLAFGQALAKMRAHPVGLIPCAMGATSLELWNPARKGDGGKSLYGATSERIRLAGQPISGILWYQGEADAADAAAAASYGTRLAAWIQAVRADLQQPDLPVLIVQLGRLMSPADANAQQWDKVREAQYLLPEQVAHTAVTSAIDLGMFDMVHLNSAGQNRLGQRLARLAMSLYDKPQQLAGPRVMAVERSATTRFEGFALRLRCTGVSKGWRPTDVMAGFVVLTATGIESPTTRIIDARPDPKDPTAIHLVLNHVPAAGELLAYGQGYMPVCTVTDSADMPLCAFQWPVALATLPAEAVR